MPSSDRVKPGFLLVANWDSGVGYAWWLMESFWVVIAEHYQTKYNVRLVYPSISKIPDSIVKSNIKTEQFDFTKINCSHVIKQCKFIVNNNIKCIYFSDQQYAHWRYILYRLCGCHIIINHDHSPGERTIPNGLKKLLKQIRMRIPFYTCNAIIGASPYIWHRAIDVACFPARQTYVAQNGLPHREISTPVNIHREIGISAQIKLIITTGRASKYKGIDFAIHCMAKLVYEKHRMDFHWLFCGDGPDLYEFQSLVNEYKLENYVTLAGRRNDIQFILPACYCAFHPSRGEVGYSLSILEYMQAGLPVIVPNNPSVCGATQDNVTGFIYNNNDIASACSAITRLLDDSETRNRMSQESSNAIKHYTLEKTHRALLSAFEKLCK